MGLNKIKIALQPNIACLLVVMLALWTSGFAQKIDSNRISLKPKAVSKIPQIKANVQSYQPKIYKYYPSVSSAATIQKEKSDKALTILKIYPNPVVEQLNISMRLDKETNLSVKITDLLGNEIATLVNEKMPYGEQTKTLNMPTKISAGIYFLKIVAGGEPIVKRISVL